MTMDRPRRQEGVRAGSPSDNGPDRPFRLVGVATRGLFVLAPSDAQVPEEDEQHDHHGGDDDPTEHVPDLTPWSR
jgi:hypothetical protein